MCPQKVKNYCHLSFQDYPMPWILGSVGAKVRFSFISHCAWPSSLSPRALIGIGCPNRMCEADNTDYKGQVLVAWEAHHLGKACTDTGILQANSLAPIQPQEPS